MKRTLEDVEGVPHGEEPVHAGSGDAEKDRGVVVALMALMLLVLLGFAGFAVDLGHWYLTASRVQNAADASALGGVVFLPAQFSTAVDIAEEIAQGHGYDPGQVVVNQTERPNQLQVTISHEVGNYFVSLFGISRTTITRSAIAEFEGPVPMGSPENYLGNDPELGNFPDHWMNVASVRNNAANGDRYQAGLCPGTGALGACTSPYPSITNPDYRIQGHFFAIEVAPGTSGPLRVQIFDPAFYEVGDRCTENQGSVFNVNNVNVANLQAQALANPDIPDDWYDDAAARYAGGPNRQWCSGDFIAGASSGGNGPITTTYIVRAPDNTPWIDTDNPVVSHPSCQPRQFIGRDNAWMRTGGGLYGRLSGGAEARVEFPPGAWQQTLANSFRRWVTVCEIPDPEPGRYLLQVKTNSPLGQPLVSDTGVNTWGHNRYSIRAGSGSPDDPTFSDGVRVFANGRLPIYVNADGADTIFYLARVTPSSTQRLLNVSLWDISDAGSGVTGSMRILPPAEWGTSFSGCTFGRTGGSFAWTNPSECSFGFNSGALDSHLVQVQVPLPEGYTCNESDPFGCWIRVNAPFSGVANDTTTWSADIVGDPVRLVD